VGDITLETVLSEIQKSNRKLGHVDKKVQTIEVLIKGNGGKGVLQRLDNVELLTDTSMSKTDCLEVRKQLEKITDRRKMDARWVVELFIKFAPWVVITLTLLGVFTGKV
jgi:hypothetical protein